MSMQVFEFQADATVSLASPAAINRKSCDHCFLNRKTCDKVRQAANSGEKCERCAKENRPCTFTPTVHLYHIADCVGRHQCRAKVIQAMGGRKKEIQFHNIDIPIICDMDSAHDQALFDFIQKQPNMLVYNNRIKSFLLQIMLGLSPDHDDTLPILDQYAQDFSNYSTSSVSPSNASQRSFANGSSPYGNNNVLTGPMPSMISPAMGPHKYHVMSPVEQQQSYRSHPYAHHQRKNSDDRSRQNIQRPPHSPRAHPVQNHQPPRHPSLANGDVLAGFSNAGRLSPLPSPNALSPIDAASAAAAVMAASYDQGFYAGNMVGITTTTASTPTANTYGVIYQQQIDQSFQSQQLQQQQQQQQPHPYAQQSPYPQASFFHQPQAQMSSYRTTSPFPPSPLAPSPIQDSPQPPSPLDLSLGMSANFGSMGNSSHQNLSSLFDTSLSMGPHVQQQHQASFHRRELSGSSTHSSLSAASPAMSSQSNNDMSTGGVTGTMCATAANPTPLVVTTTNEDGTEVGVYYAVPTVNLNPGASDADLFQDFTMMDALGEDFVWVKNLFDKSTDSASMAPVGIKAEGAENRARAGSFSSAIPAGHVSESTSSMDDLHQDQWSSQYTPQSLQG